MDQASKKNDSIKRGKAFPLAAKPDDRSRNTLATNIAIPFQNLKTWKTFVWSQRTSQT